MAAATASVNVTATGITPPLKPGYRTTEAWLTFIIAVVGAIVPSGLVLNAPVATQVVGMISAAIAVLFHGWNRTQLKRAHLEASGDFGTEESTSPAAKAGHIETSAIVLLAILGILALLCALPACSALSSTKGKSGETAAVACAVGDVAKYAAELEQDMAGAGFTAALDKFKTDHSFTQDAINCLVQTVLAVLTAQQPAEQHGQPSTIVINGRAYLAAHGGV